MPVEGTFLVSKHSLVSTKESTKAFGEALSRNESGSFDSELINGYSYIRVSLNKGSYYVTNAYVITDEGIVPNPNCGENNKVYEDFIDTIEEGDSTVKTSISCPDL